MGTSCRAYSRTSGSLGLSSTNDRARDILTGSVDPTPKTLEKYFEIVVCDNSLLVHCLAILAILLSGTLCNQSRYRDLIWSSDRGFSMSLFSSISKVALDSTGSVSGFRKVLELNPSAIAFRFPPQVEMGLKVAREVNKAVGSPLKVPSSSDLQKLAKGELDLLLKGVRNLSTTSETAKNQQGVPAEGLELLNKISWLL